MISEPENEKAVLYETGATRNTSEEKGRCDLLPMCVLTDIFNDIFFDYVDLYQKTGDCTYIFKCLTYLSQDVLKIDFPEMFLEQSFHYKEGIEKYAPRNWELGFKTEYLIDSAVRHYLKLKKGMTDESHERALVWNLTAVIWMCKNRPELNSYPINYEDILNKGIIK